jgi:hypothetical protein
VPIAWKFFLLLVAIVPSVLAVSWVGGRGMASMKVRLDAIYEDNLATTQVIGHLATALEEAEEKTLAGWVPPTPLRAPGFVRSSERKLSRRSSDT